MGPRGRPIVSDTGGRRHCELATTRRSGVGPMPAGSRAEQTALCGDLPPRRPILNCSPFGPNPAPVINPLRRASNTKPSATENNYAISVYYPKTSVNSLFLGLLLTSASLACTPYKRVETVAIGCMYTRSESFSRHATNRPERAGERIGGRSVGPHRPFPTGDSTTTGFAAEKRNRMVVECIQEVEKVKAEAKGRQRASGGDKKSAKAKSVSQKIDEPIDPHPNRTSATLAKAAGTNRRYLKMDHTFPTGNTL